MKIQIHLHSWCDFTSLYMHIYPGSCLGVWIYVAYAVCSSVSPSVSLFTYTWVSIYFSLHSSIHLHMFLLLDSSISTTLPIFPHSSHSPTLPQGHINILFTRLRSDSITSNKMVRTRKDPFQSLHLSIFLSLTLNSKYDI